MKGIALSLVVLAVGASPALAAGTVTRTGAADTSISYVASGPASVTVTQAVEPDGDLVLTFAEPAISLAGAPNECNDNGDSVSCRFTPTQTPSLSAQLGVAGGRFDAGALTRADLSLSAGDGPDQVTGTQLNDSIVTASGSDAIVAGAGLDQIGLGAEGADRVDLGPGDDRLIFVTDATPDGVADIYSAGTGTDLLYPRSVADPSPSFLVDLGAGRISIIGSPTPADSAMGFEDVQTDEGNDVLRGGPGRNVLAAGGGNDELVGALGSDVLLGEGGTDRIEARDGVADRANGGLGADTCVLDQLDEQAQCENAQVALVTPFGAILPDVDPPGCALRNVAKRPRLKRLRRGGLSLVADCDEPGRVTAVLTARLRSGRGVRIAVAGTIELTRTSRRLGAGDRAKLRLRVPAKLRRLLRPGARLRLALEATDAAGNTVATAASRRLRLRR